MILEHHRWHNTCEEEKIMNQRTPNRYSKPIVFWALNHKLEEDELRRQLKEMSDKRVGGVILHPRSGLLTPYLTDEFFEMI